MIIIAQNDVHRLLSLHVRFCDATEIAKRLYLIRASVYRALAPLPTLHQVVSRSKS